MISRFRATKKQAGEQGYAILLVVFMTTVLLMLALAVAPNIRTEGQREKEKEMVWRGSQYVRGVKLYYRKMGRFPTSIDDLTKPKIGSLRFMRQAYKDPMNVQDGSWRLIYVGPAGQLVGSLRPQQQNLQFGQPPGIGTPASALGGLGNQVSSGTTGILGALGQAGYLQQGQSSQPAQPGQPGQPGAQSGASAPGTTPASSSNPTNPLGVTGAPVSADQGTGADVQVPMGDTPTIVGGNIIGVGSKINQKSVMVYNKAKNYRLFEFIWDPSKDTFGIGQPGLQTGTGLGQVPGQNPLGQQLGQNPTNPQPAPQNPPQNPQQ